MAVYLSGDYLKQFPDFPDHMTPIGKFTYLRTYSRYIDWRQRRETWKETVTRASQYNVGLAEAHLKRIGVPVDYRKLDEETRLLFRNQFMLKQALSGRTLWVGGADNGVAKKFPLANFNCSFTNIEEWEDLAELFYLLLVGTGVGFKVTPKMARNMKPLRDGFTLEFDEINQLPKGLRSDDTRLGVDTQLEWDDENQEYKSWVEPRTATIYVGDSKEGWVDAVRKFFLLLAEERYEHVKTIRINVDSVRPEGEPLKTFGGTASGSKPLVEMFELFEKVIKSQLDDSIEAWERVGENRVRIRPIGIADMANGIGYNVVVGGVRRTSEIYLFSGDPGEIDFESLFMKFGINGLWGEKAFKHLEQVRKEAELQNIPLPKFFDQLAVKSWALADDRDNFDFGDDYNRMWSDRADAENYLEEHPELSKAGLSVKPFNFGRPLHHRRMSNNSIAFHTEQPPLKRFLDFIFLMMRGEGEPGFINLYEAARRRLKRMGITDPAIIMEYAIKIGLNPCAEILLFSKGVCNLTTVNVKAFVSKEHGILDLEGLIEAQKLSARSGLRMTLVELELPKWNEVQQRDRLLGTSLTGWKDAMALLGYTPRQERRLLKLLGKTAREEANRYAEEMRVNAPLLVTTVKPEGTLSIVFGAVSSGLHVAHAPHYIRRIRINAKDPLAKAVLEHKGWGVHAEVGTNDVTDEKKLATPELINAARTLVIDFPVASGAKKTKAQTRVKEQFDTYFAFQKNYTEHNTSNTIHIQGSEEWEYASKRIYDNWSDFVGVSFLALDNHSYKLAPNETIDEPTYLKMAAGMENFDFDKLRKHDLRPMDESTLDGAEGCEGGVCPIR